MATSTWSTVQQNTACFDSSPNQPSPGLKESSSSPQGDFSHGGGLAQGGGDGAASVVGPDARLPLSGGGTWRTAHSSGRPGWV